jgi:hypothetical protein
VRYEGGRQGLVVGNGVSSTADPRSFPSLLQRVHLPSLTLSHSIIHHPGDMSHQASIAHDTTDLGCCAMVFAALLTPRKSHGQHTQPSTLSPLLPASGSATAWTTALLIRSMAEKSLPWFSQLWFTVCTALDSRHIRTLSPLSLSSRLTFYYA